MKKYKHFKGTVYETIETNTIKGYRAKHHETQEEIIIQSTVDGKFFKQGTDERFVLYYNPEADPRILWAREYSDFHGYKVVNDTTEVKRFFLLPDEMQEEKYQHQEADIKVPSNYKQMIDDTLKRYKKFLKEDERLQELAENAETEEAQKEALQNNTNYFKHFFAGVVAKDEHDRLSVSQIKNIWERFMKTEYRGFLNAHLNLTLEDIMKVGIDKFVYVMGWTKPNDVPSWHNNRLRVGICCHCRDQFIPMILQQNQGLCVNCRSFYSLKAIRNFNIHQLNVSGRYQEASSDLLMDFYIMFYMDEKFRKLFLKGSNSAEEMEAFEEEVPEWALPKEARRKQEGDIIDSEGLQSGRP